LELRTFGAEGPVSILVIS